MRSPISKKIRFDTFKRDSFSCQYCGLTPPSVVLEIDHIHPVSKGGSNSIDNLVTSCFDCNRGKGAESLGVIPQTLADKAVLVKEKEEQLKAYLRVVDSKNKRLSKDVDLLEGVLREYFPDNTFMDRTKEMIKIQFLEHIDIHQLMANMRIACVRVHKVENAYRYFCGICWKQIRGE